MELLNILNMWAFTVFILIATLSHVITAKNVMIIYDPRSSTPFTGLVSLDVINRLKSNGSASV